jgi:hypothetical protein
MLALLILPSLSSALEIPFFISLSSSNNGFYYPDRIGKEIAWDERYYAGFGVDSLTFRCFTADLEINAVSIRDEFAPRIRTLELRYQIGHWSIAGKTSETGAGSGFAFQQRLVSEAAYDTYLFDRARFNGLEVIRNGSQSRTSVAFGGNTHNQAIARLDHSFYIPGGSVSGGVRLCARDTRWNTPSAFPVLSADYKAGSVTTKLVLAANLMPAFENEPARSEYFTAGEIVISVPWMTDITMGGSFAKREFYPFETWRMNLGITSKTGDIAISPVLDIQAMDDARSWKLLVLGEWEFALRNRIGFYYTYGFGNDVQKSHSVGLQSSLRFDF